ncbi:enoyl-CoA hydratase/isomerase family protein [Amycolatopsis acidicola]|uniref:Enoyl-CoA hydratase/isomerase family protein n=1 Tax=Amycolatopsis acidicola TaxID=2596893 RepID=A0A5N0V576_9PSEU|nr:enoyl-CoA hydratase/isomerase family protein [Amycolatopsis acidicola]KAA9159413.1 enoyl-CoA hydratase/isomerase family protein [Amycolatopsis acidicola]
MSTEDVIEVTRDGHVGIIRLTDERRRNALSNPMRDGLAAAVADFVADPDVRAMYLTGTGSTFCGGGDLRMMRAEGDTWSSYQRLTRTGKWLIELFRCPKPVVVGVNGVAVGGGIGIAMAGDVVYAAESATFISGFLRLGLIPDIGMMYTLPRAVGMTRAREFLLGQETWTAQRAETAGLITAVVPDDELDARCLERARVMAAGPLEAFGLAKSILARTFETSLDDLMHFESLGQSVAYATESMREGLSAVTGGRPADFVSATEREPATRIARARHANG